jgi:hypothetical protein
MENCIICKKPAKKSHHLIPHREKLSHGLKTYLCTDCHKILHIAELRGLCKLPKSEEQYRSWKKEMIILSAEEEVREKLLSNWGEASK